MRLYFSLLCFLASSSLMAADSPEPKQITRKIGFKENGRKHVFWTRLCKGNECVARIVEPSSKGSSPAQVRYKKQFINLDGKYIGVKSSESPASLRTKFEGLDRGLALQNYDADQ